MGADQKDSVSYFCLIFTDAVFDVVVLQTNLYPAQEQVKNLDKHCMVWHEVDKDEMRTFIALILGMGLVNTILHKYNLNESVYTNCKVHTFCEQYKMNS